MYSQKRGEYASAYGAELRSVFLPSFAVPSPRFARPQNLQLTCNCACTVSEWMNDAFVLKTLPDRKFDRSNSMLFQWCRHQDALEPRREIPRRNYSLWKKCGGTKTDLWKEKQQQLQQEIEEGFQEAIGFIHRCALWKFLEGNPTNAPAGWKCTGCQKWEAVWTVLRRNCCCPISWTR